MAGKAASGWHENYLAADIVKGTTTTVTLDRDEAFVGTSSSDRGYLVIDPYSVNCEIRKVSSIASGNVVTPVSVAATGTTGISFDATTKRIAIPTGTAAQKALLNTFYPGCAVVVTGATNAANNRVYVVTDIPRDDTYVGTFITVLDPSNLMVTEAANTSVAVRLWFSLDHPVGTRVMWLPTGTRIPLSLYGVKADNLDASATTNRTGIQRAFNEGSWSGIRDFDLPDGTTRVDDELFIEGSQHLYGVNTDTTCIRAAATFGAAYGGFTGGHIAIIHGRDNGVPVKYATSPIVIQRIFLERVWINGGSVAGSNGILLCLEQPHKIDDVRVQNCKGYGICVNTTQQASFRNLISSINGINMRLRSVEFVWLKDSNFEGLTPSGTQTLTTTDVLVEKYPGAGQIDNCTVNFDNVHIEDAGSRATTVVAGTPAKFQLAAHAYTAGMEVSFGGTTAPTGLSFGPTVYYVTNPTANDFEVSTTVGGASVAVTTAGTAVVSRNTQTAFDIRNGINFKWSGGVWQTIGTGSTFLSMATGAGGGYFSPTGTYNVSGVFWGGNPAQATAIRDPSRLTAPLTCNDYFGRQIDHLIAQVPTVPGATSPDGFHAITILGLSGAFSRFGVPASSSSFQPAYWIARQTSANPSRFIDMRSSADRKLFQVTATGAIATGANAAPADADVAAGQAFVWFDQTATQPILKIKGKDSAGTVFTGLDVRRTLTASQTWDPASLAAGATAVTVPAVAVSGAAVGDIVRVSLSTLTQAEMMLYGTVSAPNAVTVTLHNVGTNTVDVLSGTLRVEVTKYTA